MNDKKQAICGVDLFGYPVNPKSFGFISKPFPVLPSSVLDSRAGDWQERKRAWLQLGIKSEVGRSKNLLHFSDTITKQGTWEGTSIFDPILCEMAYRWFAPANGQIIDPFAGGSVRGIVAGLLGHRYWGCDLRKEQIAANKKQVADIVTLDHIPNMTPIEKHGGFMVKRDDLFTVAGVSGGKSRTAWALSRNAKGLITAGSRSSPQANIVAHIAARLGIPCRIHTTLGELSPELVDAKACGAEIIQHPAGYNNVIIARARDDANEKGWTNIPFGMECQTAVDETASQVGNIPPDTKRIVMTVGSGMSLAGVLTGLQKAGLQIPVTGIVVGADPTKRLDMYAPKGWQNMVTLIPSGSDYAQPSKTVFLGDLRLDSHYEGKCLPFLQEGDLFWIIGIRKTENEKISYVCGDSAEKLQLAPQADFVFSCPPYGDLEKYSDDEKDLSNMAFEQFCKIYRKIIALACAKLRYNRFACFVVADYRDNKGFYRNFVSETIDGFLSCGLKLYDEAILVNAAGSASMRVTRIFNGGRKLCKMHQNILVFCKGDAEIAAASCKKTEEDSII